MVQSRSCCPGASGVGPALVRYGTTDDDDDDDDDDEDNDLRSKESQIDGDPMGLGGNHGEASLECGLGQQCGLWAN